MLYLISPLTHSDPAVVVRRLEITRAAGSILAERGVDFVSGVLLGDAYVEALRVEVDHAWWMRRCLPLLRVCDRAGVLPIPGWGESNGVRDEISEAKLYRLPVETMLELYDAAAERAGLPDWRAP
jgi:hypothetical protein